MKRKIPFTDFNKLDFRIGEIRKVNEMEGYDKLYKLTVDIGKSRERTLLAGLKQSYAPDDLIGKQVVVLVNLEPKEIGGVKSQGMLLAADVNGRPVLIMPCDKVDAGVKVR